MGKYVCIRKCFHRNQLWEEGQILKTAEGDIPCHHFKSLEDSIPIVGNKGEDTGYISPFDKDRPVIIPKEEIKKEELGEESDGAIGNLRKELDVIGSAYDRRWGKVKLEHALILAKKERGL